MTKAMKQQLINDVLTGLLVAATFALVAPHDVLAQSTLSSAVEATTSTVFAPIMKVLGFGCYGAGAFFGIQGIAGAKKHADAPTQHQLGPALGKMAAGAALIAVPGVVGILAGTGSTVFGQSSGTASPITGFGGS